MQDAITARKQRGLPVLRALLASSVSVFIFANATVGLWAPRGASDKTLWAWILAVGVFGSQFLLKLTPERSKAPHALQNIAAAVEEWAPEATVGEQARMAGQVFAAVAGTQVPVLPDPPRAERPAASMTGLRQGTSGRRGSWWQRGGSGEDAGGMADPLARP